MTLSPRGLALSIVVALVGCGDSPGGAETTSGSSSGTTQATSGSGSGETEAGGSTVGGASGTGGTGGATEGETGTSGDSATGGSTGGSTTGGSEVLKECLAGVAASDAIDTLNCECQVAEGVFTDVKTCLASQPPDPDPACRCAVYSAHVEDAAVVTCLSKAVTSFLACLQPAMCAEAPTKSCLDAYFMALGECGSFSNETLAEVEIQCNQQESFKCGSGEVIPQDWTCDSTIDCFDASDEAFELCFYKCEFSGEVFPKNYRCDGAVDCADGTDEKGCP